jgi:hypothetical protein
MKFWFVVFVLMMAITGCAPTLPTLPPAPAETILQHTPALRYMEDGIQSCSLKLSPLPVLVNEYSATKMNAQSADISLVYDEPISPDLPAYLIGEDRLVVIVHPQNGLSTINLESLQGILQGFIPSWSMVDAGINAAAAPPISIVVYNQQDDFQQLIEDRMNGGGTIIQYSSLAEHPGKVVEIVAKEMGSLGIIPAAYLNDTVKELHLTGIDKNNLSIQIIVQTRSQPTQTQHTFITCLQESLSN